MNQFSAGELSRMRSVQSVAMQDTCTLITYTITLDAYGQTVNTPTESAAKACGFNPAPRAANQREERRADGTTVRIDAELRLSITDGQSLDPRSQIKITHRHGELLPTPLLFGIDGYPERGPSGVVLKLQRME